MYFDGVYFRNKDNDCLLYTSTQAVTYERETKSVAFQGKIIVLESLTPVLPPKEKEQRRKEIERCLYEVFSKYGDRFP